MVHTACIFKPIKMCRSVCSLPCFHETHSAYVPPFLSLTFSLCPPAEANDEIVKVTFGELRRDVALFAAAMRKMGLQTGDRVVGESLIYNLTFWNLHYQPRVDYRPKWTWWDEWIALIRTLSSNLLHPLFPSYFFLIAAISYFMLAGKERLSVFAQVSAFSESLHLVFSRFIFVQGRPAYFHVFPATFHWREHSFRFAHSY